MLQLFIPSNTRASTESLDVHMPQIVQMDICAWC